MSRRALLLVAAAYLLGGVVVGLLVGWRWQMQADGCTLADLSTESRRELLFSAAMARPTQREEVRCALPGMSDAAIADLAETEAEARAAGRTVDELTRALVSLASLFGRQRPDLVVFAATPGARTDEMPEASPPTPTSEATVVTPEQPFPFNVSRLQAACDDTIDVHQVQVRVVEGEGAWGRRLRLEWDGGTSEALTGLKSPAAADYADFVLEEGVEYRLFVISEAGQAQSQALGLSVRSAGCAAGERALWFVDFARRSESIP